MIGIAIGAILVFGAALTVANIRRQRRNQRSSDENYRGGKQSATHNETISNTMRMSETDLCAVSFQREAFTIEMPANVDNAISQNCDYAIEEPCLEDDDLFRPPNEGSKFLDPLGGNYVDSKHNSASTHPSHCQQTIDDEVTLRPSEEDEEPFPGNQPSNDNTQIDPASVPLKEKAESIAELEAQEIEVSNREIFKSYPNEKAAIEESGEEIAPNEGRPSALCETQFARLDRTTNLEPVLTNQTQLPTYKAPRIKVRSVRKVAKETSRNFRKGRVQVLPLIIKGRVQKGFWNFVLLASRPTGMASELEARWGNKFVDIIEVGDDWYEVLLDDVSVWFNGIVLMSEKPRSSAQWSLTKRPIHILAPNSELGSWASTTRLVLGRTHIVACETAYVERVLGILEDCGCEAVEVLDKNFGAPQGWALLFPVTPSKSVVAITGEDQLNTLRPLPDIEISLEGGIRLWNSTWMHDYPPTIYIRGDLPAGERVYVDGTLGSFSNGGAVNATGLNEVGEHQISIGGRKSAHYTIIEPYVSTEVWPSFEFKRGSICGGLVNFDPSISSFLVTIPSLTPLLLGAEPGQIYHCPWQPGTTWTTLAPFEPVWAVPTNPLRCKREQSRIIALNHKAPRRLSAGKLKRTGLLFSWIQAIRNASKKKLAIEPETSDTARLWRDYDAEARLLRRRYR